ncbi:hypothetical protein OS493_005708 [Desmophyllum pertusum]|uniref:TRADD-like N-terminal domain-containing protein n=1 Tax=Desmophyllum pertusum TaxID=174260 RepID=A0A9X0CMQ4_9CNID|nr:hypothetical protein OS493_005708 [Desmophyllum pertusum]
MRARLGLWITCEAISEPGVRGGGGVRGGVPGVRGGGSEVVAASQEPQGLQGRFLASQELQAGEVQNTTVVPITCTSCQHQPSAPGSFGGENIGINGANIPSAEGVMNFIALKYFQTVDPSKPEERNDFLNYLKEIRQVLYVDTQTGSLIITVECSSLEILEGLWNDYCTGHLNEMAQKFLVTEDILKEFGLIEVKLTTTILEEEYIACRGYFLQHSGKFKGALACVSL